MPDVLDVRDAPPPEAIPADVDAFLSELAGPTLFRVRGRDRKRRRVVAGLLHGNEPSGLRAIHLALRERELPETDVLFFLGAVEAARLPPRHGRRMPPGRRDLNRCFRPPFEQDVDGALAARVLALCTQPVPEAVVDLHNNSGRNPCYGVVTRPTGATLGLVELFARRAVVSELRLGTFTEAFDDRAPAVTIECGRAGDAAADAAASAGLRRFLRLPRVDTAFVATEQLELLVTPVRVCLRPGVRVAFADAPDAAVDVTFDAELDRHNFETLAAGTFVAWLRPEAPWPLVATTAHEPDVSHDLFVRDGDRLVARRSFLPIMMTTNPTIARDDCLCYVAHRQQ